MSRIRLNRPEYGLAHLTAETEENKNISIPLIYKQDITGTFLPAFLDYKKAKPGKGQILLSIYEEDGLGWLIAVDRDIVYFLNKDTKEVYTVARGGSYFIRKCMNCFLEYKIRPASMTILQPSRSGPLISRPCRMNWPCICCAAKPDHRTGYRSKENSEHTAAADTDTWTGIHTGIPVLFIYNICMAL